MMIIEEKPYKNEKEKRIIILQSIRLYFTQRKSIE